MCVDSELILTIWKAVWRIGDKVTGHLTPAFSLSLPFPPPNIFLVTQNSRCMALCGGSPVGPPAAPRRASHMAGGRWIPQTRAGSEISLDSGPQGEGSGIL